jgi:hypothetical protein
MNAMREKVKTTTALIALFCALTPLKNKAQTIPNYYNRNYPYLYYQQQDIYPKQQTNKTKIETLYIAAGYRFTQNPFLAAILQFNKFYFQITAIPEVQNHENLITINKITPELGIKMQAFAFKDIKFLAGINLQNNPNFFTHLFAPTLELYYQNLSLSVIVGQKTTFQIQLVYPISINNK